MTELLTGSLQENIITLLAHSDDHGSQIINSVALELYEGDYQLIAERCYEYWQSYRQAPKLHMSDLLVDILEDPHDRRAPGLRRTMIAMVQLAETINAPFVLSQLTTFIEEQRLKQALLRSADLLHGARRAGSTLVQVREILSAAARAPTQSLDLGIRLDAIDLLLSPNQRIEEFDTGIPELDGRRIVPERGNLLTLIAPTKVGKSWFLVHVGKRALLRRRKVLHVTLELSQDKVLQRYYQSLFAVPRRHIDSVPVTALDWDEHSNRLLGLSADQVKVEFSLEAHDLKLELGTRANLLGHKLSNVLIKEFPQRSLTVAGLRAFLDLLAHKINFVPDLMIIDYPKIMKIEMRDFRLNLGATVSELRGLCQEHNMAGVIAHQASRQGADARQVRGVHAGEDYSVVQTSDIILTLSATRAEKTRGLARLYVDAARDEEDSFGVILAQSHTIGQFVVDSAPFQSVYFDHLKELQRQSGETSEDGGGPDDGGE